MYMYTPTISARFLGTIAPKSCAMPYTYIYVVYPHHIFPFFGNNCPKIMCNAIHIHICSIPPLYLPVFWEQFAPKSCAVPYMYIYVVYPYFICPFFGNNLPQNLVQCHICSIPLLYLPVFWEQFAPK